ncbi:MAG: flagellar brake protein [Gammaproteobacteria bacterium]|nr:flagellar brake protein [Gammaproteobacteria bacterium]
MLNINSVLVNNALEIFNLLKNIQKSKQLISLSFSSLPQYCLTSLLEVHHDTKTLIFDEPNPLPSSKLTDSKAKAKFTLKLDQLPIIFEANIILNNNELHTNFPNEIYYPQNRNHYRFSTEYIKDIRATVFLSSTTRLPCELLNISLDGICLRFSYSYAKLFQVNQLVDDIYIELPNQNGFSISAKVQNARTVKNYSNIAVGLQIQQQKPGIEKVIQQFIFQTEKV